MKYGISADSNKPAYIQLYEQLKNDIVNGVYRYGEKLPSKRLVAEEVGVSTVTAEHGYALLYDEGYVEPKERSGYFVVFKSGEYYGSSADVPSAVRHTVESVGAYSFPLSVFVKKVRKVMADNGEYLLVKSPGKGIAELRQVISDYLFRSRGIKASADCIVIGSGAEYLYSLIAGLFGQETVFALETPSYDKIRKVYELYGARCEALPLGADGIESEALLSSSARVLHISPYRSFPTGIRATASKRHEYLRWANSGDRYIVEDDYESEFSVSKKAEETVYSLSNRGKVIYLNSFSQTISPAVRIGYMVLPPRLAEAFDEKLGFLSCTVPVLEQLLICELIRSGDFERHINRVRRIKRKQESVE